MLGQNRRSPLCNRGLRLTLCRAAAPSPLSAFGRDRPRSPSMQRPGLLHPNREPGVRHLGLSTTLRADSETFVAAADMCGRGQQTPIGARHPGRRAKRENITRGPTGEPGFHRESEQRRQRRRCEARWRRRESNPRPSSLRQSVYKLRPPLEFARRPVGSRPTAGLAILWCRASGDWLSLGAEPVR